MDKLESYAGREVQEPIYQNGAAQPCQVNVFGKPTENQVYVPRPDDQFYYPNLLTTDPGHGNNGPPINMDYGQSFNGVDPNSMQTAPNCGAYVSGLAAPGYPSQMPMPMELCQMLPVHPVMDARSNFFTPWGHFQPQMPPCPQPSYFFGPPASAQIVPSYQTVATPNGVPQWTRFESTKQLKNPETKIFRQENCSDNDPRWRTRHTIPSLGSGVSKIYYRPGDFDGCNGEMTAEEIFQTQLNAYPQLPMDAHRKIRTMPGCKITDYFDSTIVRFRSQTIVDTSPCHVVFTQKPTTGQCWLMAFSKNDRYGAVIKFNRLLTDYLKFNTNGNTAVEVQPSKMAQIIEDQFYMFNFISPADVQKFLEVLNRAMSQVWNRGQRDQNAFGRKVSSHDSPDYQFGRNDFKMSGTQLRTSSSSSELFQPKRSCRSMSNNIQDNIVDSPTFRESVQEKLLPEYCGEKEFENGAGTWNNQKNKEKFVMFSSTATMYIWAGENYANLGIGELSIVCHENSYDELIFVGPKKDVILHHHLYQWHKIKLGKEDNRYSCQWAASTVLKNSPSDFPNLRELKMEVDSEENLLEFEKAFTKGIKKGAELANVYPTD